MATVGRFCGEEMMPFFGMVVGFREGERVGFVLFGWVQLLMSYGKKSSVKYFESINNIKAL